MTNLNDLLITHKFADNNFRAAAIVTGLKLWELKTEAEQLARVRLYRDWRTSKIFGSKTAPCFEKALAGEAVPVTMELVSE